MKTLYKFSYDCGRMGSLDGLFVAESDDLVAAYGHQVHFGEVLGKHSDVSVRLDESQFTAISIDPEKITWLLDIIGTDTISGFNPLSYMDEDEDDEDEHEDDD
jgi:hypothetical protein